MNRYQHQLEALASSSYPTYLRLVESGMFWVWFPWAKGDYQQDVEKAKLILERSVMTQEELDKLNRKRYHFNNDSWWDNPGCDCCEGMWMQCYNIDTDLHPQMLQNGSAHSIEDCMIDVLDHHNIIDAQSDWRALYGIGHWEEEWEWLLNTMQENGLQVKIEGEGVFP